MTLAECLEIVTGTSSIGLSNLAWNHQASPSPRSYFNVKHTDVVFTQRKRAGAYQQRSY